VSKPASGVLQSLAATNHTCNSQSRSSDLLETSRQVC